MKSIEAVESDFRSKVCGDLRIVPDGLNRFRVLTPFTLDDGDRVSLVLKRRDERWMLSDEGSTHMRLSYRLDDRALQTEARSKLVSNALDAGGVVDEAGELLAPVENDQYGNALFSLIQAVIRISDVALLTREQVRSTFREDVRELLERLIPARRRVSGWHHPTLDREGHYPVDWYVETADIPMFIFALTTEDNVKDATITLHQFERWNVLHRTVGIFQDQQEISQKALARFTDVAEKNFSALYGNEDRIQQYLRQAIPDPALVNN